MANVIGEFVAKIGAETKGFDRGVDRSKQKMSGFAGAFQRHSKAIKVAALAAGAAIVGMGIKSVMTFAKMGDEIQKMAKRTGFSTEALSELRFVAEQSGASLNMLEKAVRKQAKTILDATDGLTTYVRVFDRLGLKAEELIQMKPEEAFFKIANAVAEVENEQIRAATASDLWGGRVGTMLLPMLDAGAQGIADLRQEAHDLGLVFDQLSADKAARLTDAMNAQKRAVDGLALQIGDLVAGPLTQLAEGWTEIIKMMRPGGGGIGAIFDRMKAEAKGLKSPFEATKEGVEALFETPEEAVTESGGISDAFNEWDKQFQELTKNVVAGAQSQAAAIGSIGSAMGQVTDASAGGFIDPVSGEVVTAEMAERLRKIKLAVAAGATGGGLQGLVGFAEGGIVTKPTLAMIGENGPEAVVPLDGSGMMGGMTVNFNTPVNDEDEARRLARIFSEEAGYDLSRQMRMRTHG